MNDLKRYISGKNFSLHELNGEYVLIRNTKMLSSPDKDGKSYWQRRVVPFNREKMSFDFGAAFFISENEYRKNAAKIKSPRLAVKPK